MSLSLFSGLSFAAADNILILCKWSSSKKSSRWWILFIVWHSGREVFYDAPRKDNYWCIGSDFGNLISLLRGRLSLSRAIGRGSDWIISFRESRLTQEMHATNGVSPTAFDFLPFLRRQLPCNEMKSKATHFLIFHSLFPLALLWFEVIDKSLNPRKMHAVGLRERTFKSNFMNYLFNIRKCCLISTIPTPVSHLDCNWTEAICRHQVDANNCVTLQ